MFSWKRRLERLTLLSAYKSSKLTWQSPGPIAFWLFKKQHHSEQLSPDEMFSYRTERVSTEKALPAQYFHYQKSKTETQLFLLLEDLWGPIHPAVYMNQVFTINIFYWSTMILKIYWQHKYNSYRPDSSICGYCMHRICATLSSTCCTMANTTTTAQLIIKGVEMEQKSKHTSLWPHL